MPSATPAWALGPRQRTAMLRLLGAFLTGAGFGALLLQFCLAWLGRRRALARSHTFLARKLQAGRRRPIIGITGSGTNEEAMLASLLGEWCAACGFHILTGGGGGVMTSVSRAFSKARFAAEAAAPGSCGLALAVLPGLPAARADDWARAREEVTSKLLVDQSGGKLQYSVVLDGFDDNEEERIVAPNGYPNDFVDISVRTHLPSSGGKGMAAFSRNHISVLSADVIIALPGGAGTASEVALAVRYGVPVCQFLRRGSEGGTAELPDTVAACVPAFEEFQELQDFVVGAIASRQQVKLSSKGAMRTSRSENRRLDLLS
eukprot:TRINITY_DN92116_c0_g1_i1.p1 TRINITY_DN92116_c0_g1~~TRINITY_DN92116_c0_g1_i1.p1  ORF type:complete len:318 (+),score=57.94 TRINITY_DN92116_c0_g1_i1:31-984(+)